MCVCVCVCVYFIRLSFSLLSFWHNKERANDESFNVGRACEDERKKEDGALSNEAVLHVLFLHRSSLSAANKCRSTGVEVCEKSEGGAGESGKGPLQQ